MVWVALCADNDEGAVLSLPSCAAAAAILRGLSAVSWASYHTQQVQMVSSACACVVQGEAFLATTAGNGTAQCKIEDYKVGPWAHASA